MPAPIPEMIKSRVIMQWLQALSRDAIAQNNNISTGGVSNIIDEWENALGKPDADALRELAKSLKMEGITPAECASGFRIANLLSGHGISRETAEHFVTDILKRCEDLGLTTNKALQYIEDLVKFSEHVRLPQIKDYLDEKTAEKRQLEDGVQKLEDKMSRLKKEVSEAENDLSFILKARAKATEEMSSFSKARQELDRHNISIADVSKFANAVKYFSENGLNPNLLEEFKGVGHISERVRALGMEEGEKERNIEILNQRENILRNAVKHRTEEMSVYNDLADIGIRRRELRVIYNLTLNITKSNGFDYQQGVEKFIADIGSQYDLKLGFESEIAKLRMDKGILEVELEDMTQKLTKKHMVAAVVMKLFQLGLTENDIIRFAGSYICLLNRTFSAEDLKKELIKTIDMMKSGRLTVSNTVSNNDKMMSILDRVRQDLSDLKFDN